MPSTFKLADGGNAFKLIASPVDTAAVEKPQGLWSQIMEALLPLLMVIIPQIFMMLFALWRHPVTFDMNGPFINTRKVDFPDVLIIISGVVIFGGWIFSVCAATLAYTSQSLFKKQLAIILTTSAIGIILLISTLTSTPMSNSHGTFASWAKQRYDVTVTTDSFKSGTLIQDENTKEVFTIQNTKDGVLLYDMKAVNEIPLVGAVKK